MDYAGNIDFVDINCAVVTPNAPAAGYIPPEIEGIFDEVTAGIGTGSLIPEIINPTAIMENSTYRIIFESEGQFPDYTTTAYGIYQVQPDTVMPLITGIDASEFGEGISSPLVDGFVVSVEIDTPIAVNPLETGWLIGNSNLDMEVSPGPRPWPAHYKITFYDSVQDTSLGNNIPLNFEIQNLTDNEQAAVFLWDEDGSRTLSIGDSISIFEYIGNTPYEAWDIKYYPPFNAIPREPVPGDEYLIYINRPFYERDYFEFTTRASRTDLDVAKESLSMIKVVPNPYIATASWEPRNLYGTGRGERKIDFIHLPAVCTIRIFTISGVLVKTINHSNPVEDGSHSWDLITEDGMEVAYGVYIYHVDAPGLGRYVSKFAVVK
jgi:hypothetical protein